MPGSGDSGHPVPDRLTPGSGLHVTWVMTHPTHGTAHEVTPVVVRMFEAACVVPAERTAWLAAGFEPSVALNYLSAGASVDDALEWRKDGSDANTYGRFRSLLRTSKLFDTETDREQRRRRTRSARRASRNAPGPLITVRLEWGAVPRTGVRPGCHWEIWAPEEEGTAMHGRYEAVCVDHAPGATVRSMHAIGLGLTRHRTLRSALQHVGEAAFTVRGELQVAIQSPSASVRPLLMEALPRLVPVDGVEYGVRKRERPRAPDFVLLE